MIVRKKSFGFTLVELVVSIGIFMVITTLLIVKYGNFNQSVLLTNLAYDVALSIRTAQTYGTSVKKAVPYSYNQGSPSAPFQYAYGIVFCTLDSGCNSPDASVSLTNQNIIIFADVDGDGAFDNSDFAVENYNIKRGAKVFQACGSFNGCANKARIDITFVRPNPNAFICGSDTSSGVSCVSNGAWLDPKHPYITNIVIQAPDGSTRTITVRINGQILVAQ